MTRAIGSCEPHTGAGEIHDVSPSGWLHPRAHTRWLGRALAASPAAKSSVYAGSGPATICARLGVK